MNDIKYNSEIHDVIAYALTKKGFEPVDIADAIGILPELLAVWMMDNESLRRSAEEGAKLANLAVEACLFIRCQGMEYDEKESKQEKDDEGKIKTTAVIRRRKIPPDVKACITWLEVHNPGKWKRQEPEQPKAIQQKSSIYCQTCGKQFATINDYVKNHNDCDKPDAVEMLPAEN